MLSPKKKCDALMGDKWYLSEVYFFFLLLGMSLSIFLDCSGAFSYSPLGKLMFRNFGKVEFNKGDKMGKYGV